MKTMTSPRKSGFSQRLDQVIESLWTADYQSIVSALDEVEADLGADQPTEQGITERRRAVADVRLLAAHKKMQPVARCDDAFSSRTQLGFATIADESVTVCAHARYCQQAGETEMAVKYAAAILGKVEQTRQTATSGPLDIPEQRAPTIHVSLTNKVRELPRLALLVAYEKVDLCATVCRRSAIDNDSTTWLAT